ncbi:MAG: cytochrome c oxidase subunit II transmembrane domain-containing protein, partial [Pseudomonadota bacterium]|nr:cytochrome c oxidase subunit II transmembrane domain-containing protein [Pseudomonadota bacterium]
MRVGLPQHGSIKMSSKRQLFRFTSMLGTLLIPGIASAAQPEPWQMNFQQAATPLMEQIVRFHDVYLLPT